MQAQITACYARQADESILCKLTCGRLLKSLSCTWLKVARSSGLLSESTFGLQAHAKRPAQAHREALPSLIGAKTIQG